MKSRSLPSMLGWLCAAFLVPSSLHAQSYLQADITENSSVFVASQARGPLSFGVARVEDDDGVSTTATLRYTAQVAGTTLGLGPAVRRDKEGTDWGVRATVDRYLDFKTSGVFLLAEYTSIEDSSFALASWKHYESGWGSEFSVFKESGEDVSRTVVLTRRLGEQTNLRLGYKIDDQQFLLGISHSFP